MKTLRIALPVIYLALITLAALAMPVISRFYGYDATGGDLLARLTPPDAAHWLGTDALGRDVLMRLIDGARSTLLVGVAGAAATALIGTAIGLAAGLGNRTAEHILMRFTDMVIALPALPVLIVLSAINAGGQGLLWIVLVIAAFAWPGVARLVRGGAKAAKAQLYVTAARALGATPLRVALAHVLPNILGPVVIATALSMGTVILAESALSFLGFGIQPPAASWGAMLDEAQETIWDAPRLAVLPGLLIFLTVLSVNVLADALQHKHR